MQLTQLAMKLRIKRLCVSSDAHPLFSGQEEVTVSSHERGALGSFQQGLHHKAERRGEESEQGESAGWFDNEIPLRGQTAGESDNTQRHRRSNGSQLHHMSPPQWNAEDISCLTSAGNRGFMQSLHGWEVLLSAGQFYYLKLLPLSSPKKLCRGVKCFVVKKTHCPFLSIYFTVILLVKKSRIVSDKKKHLEFASENGR